MRSTTPHNAYMLALSMKWLYGEYRKPLDQYDIVKLHILADFRHILENGEPFIGGQPAAWPYGPVVRDSYFQAMQWASDGGQFKLQSQDKNVYRMIPCQPLTEQERQEIPEEALQALVQSWEFHAPMSFAESDAYFHQGPDFGTVWQRARQTGVGTLIDWCEIVDAYDAHRGEDHSHIKTLLNASSNDELMEIAQKRMAPRGYWTGEID